MGKGERLRYHGPTGMARYTIPDAPESDERFKPGVKSIQEAAREVEVISEADVIVVGGGPGGFAAAVAAARTGSRTFLLERFFQRPLDSDNTTSIAAQQSEVDDIIRNFNHI